MFLILWLCIADVDNEKWIKFASLLTGNTTAIAATSEGSGLWRRKWIIECKQERDIFWESRNLNTNAFTYIKSNPQKPTKYHSISDRYYKFGILIWFRTIISDSIGTFNSYNIINGKLTLMFGYVFENFFLVFKTIHYILWYTNILH